MNAISLSAPNIDPKAQNKFITFVIVIVAYFIIRSEWRRFQTQRTYDSLTTDPNAQLALRFQQAFNPSGTGWLENFDGTNVDEVYAIASEVRDFPAVATAYQRLYNETLQDRLQKELNPSEYQRFLAVLGSATGTSTGTVTKPAAGKSKVYCVIGGPLRDADKPNDTVRMVKPGEEIGVFLANITINFTNTGKFPAVQVRYTNWLGFEYTGVIESRFVSVR